MSSYDSLKLSNQLCYPVYLCAKEIVNKYTKFLSDFGLSYTQYIILMELWENESVKAKELSESVGLDPSTLSPVLKKMEQKGLILKKRCVNDERCFTITVTEEGYALRDRLLSVPEKMRKCFDLSPEEGMMMYKLINKIIANLKEGDKDNGN